MIAEVRERLTGAASICVLTGSGISAESGLPTFRGAGGLWKTHRVEELASPAGFARDPDLVWNWYNERRAVHLAAEPNAGHRALAVLERRFATLPSGFAERSRTSRKLALRPLRHVRG